MRWSIEPCHPLGFWGRDMESQVRSADFSTPRVAIRFLELNTLVQLEGSFDRGANSAARLMDDESTTVVFLLDDLFASDELMDLVPPERVAEMMVDIWERRVDGSSLPSACTVVSERSLAPAGLAVLGVEAMSDAVPVVVKDYQGVQITAPTQARAYVGDLVPSCPLLAAVWQMWRLGRLAHCTDQISWWGNQPSHTERSLTILNTSLMNVEIAAAAILDTYDPETLGCMGYLFQPDHW